MVFYLFGRFLAIGRGVETSRLRLWLAHEVISSIRPHATNTNKRKPKVVSYTAQTHAHYGSPSVVIVTVYKVLRYVGVFRNQGPLILTPISGALFVRAPTRRTPNF